ncbi:MAG TPA: DUF6776 family protein [Steroidobacteraceae bacterium]|nr:DUF6776 family protein [Steroidobacteraceae bacterium]
MAESLRKLVVRSYAPKRRAAVLGASLVAALLCVYAVFEFGRYEGGYRVIAAARHEWAADRRIKALKDENARQRAELAADEVAQRVDREGHAQVERNLADMQGQIARLQQSLAFYQGLVQPDSIVGVKVQQMQIVPGPGANQFALKFMLMQVGKAAGSVAGRVDLTILGTRQGRPETLTFAQVAVPRVARLAYSFRYFQEYDQMLQLPPGFAPSRVGVELHSGKGGRGYRQAFLWRTQGMSSEADGGTAQR